MRLKYLLRNLFNKKKVYINKNVVVKKSSLDLTINDEKLLITLGQWLNVLPDSVKTWGMGMSVYDPLSSDDFLKRFEITEEQEEEIITRMAYLLSSIGIEDDFGVLEHFDEENLTFKGEFFKQDYSYDFEITWGDFFEHCAQLRVNDGNEYYKYDYIHATGDRPDKLVLDSYTHRVDKEHTYYHYNSDYRFFGDVYNDDYKVSFEVEYPQSLSCETDSKKYIDEVLIESILTTIKFPADIQLLCKRLSETLKCDPAIFPNILIVVSKKNKDSSKEKETITDKVVFKFGQFYKFIITKDGKTIEIDKFDNWKVDSSSYSISGDSSNDISYSIKHMSKEDYDSLGDIPTLIDLESYEAHSVKDIPLVLVNKKKSN